ncbi:MAG: diguanylate cyclase [Gordonia polyisoprenivorans]|nr:diguanylate cyclase [Gordonia polyisoprenivorans]
MGRRFDQRSLAVLASTAGATVMPVFVVWSPWFVRPGGFTWLCVIWAFSAACLLFTAIVGRLTNTQFAVLGCGGMVGVAGSAYLVADPGSARAILVLLAGIPAIAAMQSPPRVVVAFVAVAATLAGVVTVLTATSSTALIVGGAAALMAVSVPTAIVVALRQSLMQMVQYLAVVGDTDALTGALNRRGLASRLPRSLAACAATGSGLGVAVIDVDHFKSINDRYGHTEGDRILSELVTVLTAALPDSAVVARAGGEEFVVAVPVTCEHHLCDLADDLRSEVSARLPVTVSIGAVHVSLTAEPARSREGPPDLDEGMRGAAPFVGSADSNQYRGTHPVLDELLRHADGNLYTAKELGRNRVITSTGVTFAVPSAVGGPPGSRPRDSRRRVPSSTVGKRLKSTFADTHRRRSTVPASSTNADRGSDRTRPDPAPSQSLRHEVSMIDILDPRDDGDRITALHGQPGMHVVDGWAEAAPELEILRSLTGADPEHRSIPTVDLSDPAAVERASRYIVFPWRSTMVRLPDAHTYYFLRTARNRHLLTDGEQHRWANATVAIAGLSVGSSALTACALTGARRFRIADYDTLAPTNLNRITGSVCDLGRTKLDLARRRILELDPYSIIEAFPLGYSPACAARFIGIDGAAPTAAVVIDEIDDVAMKIDLRRRARTAGVPVITATDLGDNVVLDVERYDLDPTYPIYHGRGEHFTAGDAVNPAQRLRMAAAIVGDEATPRMRYSATQIGRSVTSWPQLGSTVSIAGGFAATAARLITCGHPITSGRYRLTVDDELLGPAAAEASAWNELDAETFNAFIAASTTDTPDAER